ncbi:alpha carbonic anhydrase 1 [Euphorbia peplus]|nr:alpha carbonic anhydrase 1 [Euphorbia peplus]
MAFFFFSPLIFIALLHSASAYLDSDDPTRMIFYGVDPGHAVHFSYKETHEWGKTFKTCSEGKNQSPININESKIVLSKSLKPLTRFYAPAKAFLVDNGINIGVRYESDHASMAIDDKNYTMRFMHWHTPSEHLFNGVQYPLELHLVHEAPDKSIAVVGLLYQIGQPDQFIQSINTSLAQLSEMVKEGKKPAEVSLGMLDTKLLGKKTNKYYRYNGSLTTPPCNEPVIWTVIPRIKTVSEEQVEAMKSALEKDFKNNFRPVQPLNGRQVQMYVGN